jgi:hypothetical protein
MTNPSLWWALGIFPVKYRSLFKSSCLRSYWEKHEAVRPADLNPFYSQLETAYIPAELTWVHQIKLVCLSMDDRQACLENQWWGAYPEASNCWGSSRHRIKWCQAKAVQTLEIITLKGEFLVPGPLITVVGSGDIGTVKKTRPFLVELTF